MQIAKPRISKNGFHLWLPVYGMSMTNAKKSLEYTYNLFVWTKYWATVKQLWALKILKIQSNFVGWGLTLVAYKIKRICDISKVIVMNSKNEKIQKNSL